jgi:hypothetical protein
MNKKDDLTLFLPSKMPVWARTMLANVGIEPELKESDLTEEQLTEIQVVTAYINLYYKGLINVSYNPETDDAPEFSLTKAGVREAKKITKEEQQY